MERVLDGGRFRRRVSIGVLDEEFQMETALDGDFPFESLGIRNSFISAIVRCVQESRRWTLPYKSDRCAPDPDKSRSDSEVWWFPLIALHPKGSGRPGSAPLGQELGGLFQEIISVSWPGDSLAESPFIWELVHCRWTSAIERHREPEATAKRLDLLRQNVSCLATNRGALRWTSLVQIFCNLPFLYLH